MSAAVPPRHPRIATNSTVGWMLAGSHIKGREPSLPKQRRIGHQRPPRVDAHSMPMIWEPLQLFPSSSVRQPPFPKPSSPVRRPSSSGGGGGRARVWRTRRMGGSEAGEATRTAGTGNQNVGDGRACAWGAATTQGMAWPASPVATGCQDNPCSTGIRWGVSPAAQMGCLRNRRGCHQGHTSREGERDNKGPPAHTPHQHPQPTQGRPHPPPPHLWSPQPDPPPFRTQRNIGR